MARPITWQSIGAPNVGSSSDTLAGARDSFKNALGSLQGVMTQRNQMEDYNWNTGRDNNTNAMLDRIQQLQTVEAAQAAMSSGELSNMTAGFGAQVDRSAVRNAQNNLLPNLQKRAVADQLYGENQTRVAQQDVVAQVQMELSAADTPAKVDAARQRLSQLVSSGGLTSMSGAALGERATSRNAAVIAEAAAATKADAEKLRAPIELEGLVNRNKLTSAQIKATEVRAVNSVEDRENARKDRVLLEEQREVVKKAAQAEAVQKLMKDTGNVYSDGVFDPNNVEPVMKMMTDLGIGDDAGERQAVIKRLTGLADREHQYIDENGKPASIKIPVPLSLARQAILGSNDNMFNMWNQGYANSVEENYRKSTNRTVDLETEDGRPYKQNAAVFDFQQYMKNALQRSENPTSSAPKKNR